MARSIQSIVSSFHVALDFFFLCFQRALTLDQVGLEKMFPEDISPFIEEAFSVQFSFQNSRRLLDERWNVFKEHFLQVQLI